MRKIVLLLAVTVTLTACSGDFVDHSLYKGTAPGYPLPAFAAGCLEFDSLARCKQWSNPSHLCIHPKGPVPPRPTLPCAEITKDMYHDKR